VAPGLAAPFGLANAGERVGFIPLPQLFYLKELYSRKSLGIHE
jgi:hypothetical protein